MAMEEGKKRSRWAESLHEAGLLDEIEDSWVLPEDKPVDGSTITVEGSGEDPERPPADAPAEAAAPREVPAGSAVELPQTPVERTRSSDPRPAEPTVDTPMAVPRTSQVDAPLPVQSAKKTATGMTTIPARKPTGPLTEPPTVSIPPLEDVAPEPAEPAESEQAAVVEVEVRGSRISVPPDAAGDEAEAQPVIVDQPPGGGGDEQQQREAMSERYELGDYTGALEIAEAILRELPHDKEAANYAESCREVLIQMYEARIGPFDRVPEVAVSEHELIWRNLDPATGFVLSRIDGYSTFEDIVDISGLPRFETCRILGQLLQEGIIK
jgi:hypothetical protein